LDSAWKTEKIGSNLAYPHSSAKQCGTSTEFVVGTLVQADTHLLGAIIQLLQESTVKAAWNLRKSFKFYESVHSILTTSYSKPDKDALTGWSQFGMGLFSVIISLLPPTVITIASWIGFNGDRELGLSSLRSSISSPSFYSPYSCLFLLSFYVSISAFTGEETPSHLAHAASLLAGAEKEYPDSCFFQLMRSRLHRCRGELTQAIQVSEKAIEGVKELPSVAILFHYQSGWCAFFLLEF